MDKEILYKEMIRQEIEGGLNGIDIGEFVREIRSQGKNRGELERVINDLRGEELISTTLEIEDTGEVSVKILVDMEKVDIELLEELTKDYKAYKLIMKVEINPSIIAKIEKIIIRKDLPSKEAVKKGLKEPGVIKDIKIEALKDDVVDLVRRKGEILK